jgi:hypothetical protein
VSDQAQKRNEGKTQGFRKNNTELGKVFTGTIRRDFTELQKMAAV